MESKLYLKTKRVKIDLTETIDVLTKIFLKLGYSNELAKKYQHIYQMQIFVEWKVMG
tara:strand:+ start:577 stop:747 length:171 start_codon:yes stop_codon:yes gene_type:complete